MTLVILPLKEEKFNMLNNLDFKLQYRSSDSNIYEDFYYPCLKIQFHMIVHQVILRVKALNY